MAEIFEGRIGTDCEEVLSGAVAALEPLKGQTLLVTGGTGFVGTWLSRMVFHLNDNYDFKVRLILLSRMTAGVPAHVSKVLGRNDVDIVEQDVRNISDLPREVSLIIHAAASPDNRVHASDPVGTLDVIGNGTRIVLGAATRLPALSRILCLSSGLVNGFQPPDVAAVTEGDAFVPPDPAAVGSSYTEAKRYAETIAAGFRSQYRLPVIVARPFAFIGPYQSLDRPWAINNFMRDGLLGSPIRIQGKGDTVRSYMYGSDVAHWLLRILLDGMIGVTYNVGSPVGVPLKDVAAIVATSFHPRPAIATGIAPQDAQRASRLVPDTTLAQETLGLTLKVPLAVAIERTITWNRLHGFGNDQLRRDGGAVSIV